MRPRSSNTLAIALLVMLAGCASGLGGSDGAGTVTDGGVDGSPGETGTLAFYLRDQPSAIGDFSHLNVTVTQVGFHPKGAENEPEDDSQSGDGPASEEPTEAAVTDTPTVRGSPTQTTPVTGSETEATPEDGNGNEVGGWVIEPVDNRTVDLTTLVGSNATQIAGVELPAGEYTGVFIWVSEIEASLQDGSSAEVKLPSERLKLNTQFTIQPNTSIDFVFDITVVETGNGHYILKPVISESGTDVPINRVGETGRPTTIGTAADGGPPDEAGNRSGDAGGSGQGQGGQG